jgi:homoserine kinase
VLFRPGHISRLEPADGLRPVVCIPEVRQATEAARGLLPASVPLAAAAANGARTAAVLAGLAGIVPLDVEAMTDVLQEPARFVALPGTARLVDALRSDGVPACLSGSGPSVLAVVPAGSDDAVMRVRALAGAGWDVRPVGWDRAGVVACGT